MLIDIVDQSISAQEHLAERAARTLLVATGSAGGADDNHASTLAAVLVSRHVGDVLGGGGSELVL